MLRFELTAEIFLAPALAAFSSASLRPICNKVPVNKIGEFEKNFIGLLRAQHNQVLINFRAGKFDDADANTIKKVALEEAAKY